MCAWQRAHTTWVNLDASGIDQFCGLVQEAAWLEQQEALLAMQAAMPVRPIYTRVPAKKLRTPELDDAESQQYSPYPRFSRCATLAATCSSSQALDHHVVMRLPVSGLSGISMCQTTGVPKCPRTAGVMQEACEDSKGPHGGAAKVAW